MNISLIKKYISIIVIVLINIVILIPNKVLSAQPNNNDEIAKSIQQIFKNRNEAIVDGNLELIQGIYNTNTRYGVWAYEHEKKKVEYIRNWEAKQGVKITHIIPKIVIRSIKGNENKISVNLICSTEYKYIYEDDPKTVNTSRIGTEHYLQLINKDNKWIIIKEWYKDPFADSLNLDNLKVDSIKQYILSNKARDFTNINERRIGALNYANQYCGIAAEEKYGFKYNRSYRNYNPEGGDCANFASQMLFEGGEFRKNFTWNYNSKDATRSWLNADGLKNYMIYSGRASVVAYGNYEKVYKESYNLLPGDFVAYEKKGDVTHISVVTGADSRGYTLVTCHNTDRNNVPWDLGWSDKNIKFWLINVHY